MNNTNSSSNKLGKKIWNKVIDAYNSSSKIVKT